MIKQGILPFAYFLQTETHFNCIGFNPCFKLVANDRDSMEHFSNIAITFFCGILMSHI